MIRLAGTFIRIRASSRRPRSLREMIEIDLLNLYHAGVWFEVLKEEIDLGKYDLDGQVTKGMAEAIDTQCSVLASLLEPFEARISLRAIDQIQQRAMMVHQHFSKITWREMRGHIGFLTETLLHEFGE